MAKCIMVQGTCSNAGKSLLCAALCRIFRQDGWRVAPFKAQNMALNSYITADGGEMGRAQVVQAEAAGIAPDVRMNPILLKPTSDVGSQVIVLGQARGNRTAREYWGDKKALMPVVKDAYDSLAAEYDIIVIEGAGSPAEINLKQDDIVNMGLARLVDAPVLLVGDIDRGGVFASLYGTVKLLDADEQARIRALVINKFRGDVEILKPGLSQLEELTGKPVAGVVPYGHFDIDDEDSLSARLDGDARGAAVRIAVVRLPRISNFTDFAALERVPGVGVCYADKSAQLTDADLIIVPGSKATLADLRWLRESGMEAQLLRQHAAGTPVLGICGGFQMLGRTASDPENTEGGGSLRGIGLLPVDTVFRARKTTTQARGTVKTLSGALAGLSGAAVEGYEIHMGETTRAAGAQPFSTLTHADGAAVEDGCQAENVYGTYLHGVFDAPGVAQKLAQALAARKGVTLGETSPDTAAYKEREYDRLADAVRQALDMDLIYRILEGKA
nr:cobyric acid synthase [uncultured Agathobaculum sp.]